VVHAFLERYRPVAEAENSIDSLHQDRVGTLVQTARQAECRLLKLFGDSRDTDRGLAESGLKISTERLRSPVPILAVPVFSLASNGLILVPVPKLRTIMVCNSNARPDENAQSCL